MIYVVMDGRLGNQLFRYAFVRLLKKNNTQQEIVYDFSDFIALNKGKGDGWGNSLKNFNTLGTENYGKVRYSFIQKILHKLYWESTHNCSTFSKRYKKDKLWAPLLQFFGLYLFNLGYYPFPLKKHWWVKNLVVDGCFECYQYAEMIKDELKKEFIPKSPLCPSNVELMNHICSGNSIAISIRRGDFFDDPEIGNVYSVCTKQYYEKAIALMKSKISTPVFIFFSNDIKWVKENIHIADCECFYESGIDEVWETMRLMSSCKNFIISNSTMHWWAQFLSDNPDKIVIAPSKWYNDKMHSAVYQNNWILIDV